MSPNRRDVGCVGVDVVVENGMTVVAERKVVGVGLAKTKKLAKKRKNAKKKAAETGNRTSPTMACVRNLGNSPRVPGADSGKFLPTGRDERQNRPTHQRIMTLLSMAVVPEERIAFRRRFVKAMRGGDGECRELLCFTPVSVIAKAFGCKPFQLRSAADMFPESGLQSEFLNEFYVMDVILNRAPSPAVLTGGGKGGRSGGGGRRSHCDDCDAVRHALSRKPEDIGPGMDHFYRAAILFLPQCGVFYCHRDRHVGDAGVPGTLRAYDMSWLRLQRTEGTEHDFPLYAFGGDSFVRRFYSDRGLGDNRRVSAWRISTGYLPVPYRIGLCTGPFTIVMLNYLRYHQISLLALTCGLSLLTTALMNSATNSEILVVRSLIAGITLTAATTTICRSLAGSSIQKKLTSLMFTFASMEFQTIRVSGAKGTARAKSSDVGSMFALGTRIEKKESPTGVAVHSKIPYAANGCVSDSVLRGLVVDLATLGSRCFPVVYSVVRDTEENSGLSPVPPMDGVALPTGGSCGRGGSDCDGENCVDDDDDDERDGGDCLRKELWRKMEAQERRQRVGYTVDMSINLGNSSHYDVNDASQGYSVWTEEVRGLGKNWYFVIPSVCGLRPGTKTKFSGMAVKLGHGVAISWDGRVIRHCTSVSCPDGMERGFVARKRGSPFRNYLYGTFTAAKEKIVEAGRAACAEAFCPGKPSPVKAVVDRKKRPNRRRRKPRGGGASDRIRGCRGCGCRLSCC
ncbi:hypothetical protein MHU86_2299 [Fragilaria crotonensis]|nr:hypothetical protein MHU86_2299 [Fragilaria crotonensis]